MSRILLDARYFQQWQGGRAYLQNLIKVLGLAKLNVLELKQDETFTSLDSVSEVYPDRFSLDRIRFKLNRKITWKKLNPWISTIKYSLQVSSHDINKLVTSIRWIPDFQHLELPEYFTKDEIKKREMEFERFAIEYDIILLSSEHAKQLYVDKYPRFAHKARVYPFAVTLPELFFQIRWEDIKRKYNLPDQFIHFPGQWWKHKRHDFIFSIYQENDLPPLVLTGIEQDYRNPDYIKQLNISFYNTKCNKNIIRLGEIPYYEMLAIMRQSMAILNPSDYEGWSTTVEEAKLMKKKIITSSFPVFREQLRDVENCSFLDLVPNDWIEALKNNHLSKINSDDIREQENKILKEKANIIKVIFES